MKKLLKLMMAVVLAATLILPVSAENHYTVTVDLGEGTFYDDGSHKKTVDVKEGEHLYNVLFPQSSTKDTCLYGCGVAPMTQDGGPEDPLYIPPQGYDIIGYSLIGETEIAFTVGEFVKFVPSEDVELNARYGKWLNVTFDYNGGCSNIEYPYTFSDSVRVLENTTMGYFYKCPDSFNENEAFAGWSTRPNGEPEYTNDELSKRIITHDMTFYAIYKPAITITLDQNGGRLWSTNTYKAPKGYPFEKYSSTPSSPEDGKYFIGWSRTKDGNVDYENIRYAVFNENVTLYAVYGDTKEKIPVESYEIPEEITMNVGDEIFYPLKVTPANANYSFSIHSHNDSVARIDSSNRILARREGVAEIYYSFVYHANHQINDGIRNRICRKVKINVKMPYINLAFLGIGDKQYWYENGVRQGMFNDAKNIMGDGTPRGREIYDPASDGWYWLDAIYDGAKAEGKEVWVPYVYQDEDKWGDAEIRMNANHADDGMKEYTFQCMKNKTGKWVRYDGNGKMLKGWVKIEDDLAKIYPQQTGNVYYYDHFTGLMAKGSLKIDGEYHYFDEITGIMVY